MVTRGGQQVHLTPTEFGLLRYLAQHAGRVVTHGQLLRGVFGPGSSDTSANLRVHVAGLRKKLETNPAQPEVLVTEPGVGYRLAEAETGEDGVRLAKELRPDLVLMDIQLPGINGIAALGQIRDDPAIRDTPVIAVTASAMTQDRQKIMAAGFNGYQSKPINVKDFLAAVRAMLDQKT